MIEKKIQFYIQIDPLHWKWHFRCFILAKIFLVDFLSKTYSYLKNNSSWLFNYVYICLPFGLTEDSFWIPLLFNFAFLFENLLSNDMLWSITGASQTRPDGHSDRDGISERPSRSHHVVSKARYHWSLLWTRIV